MNKVEVSIIMPTYNVGHVVSQTIESVLNQTYSNWELVIVDDCSNDNTLDIVKKYASKYENIKFIESKYNNGAGISRNLGIQSAQGRFLAFLDSDDIWFPEKLERQIFYMKANEFPICHTAFNFINEAGETRSGAVYVSASINLIDNLKTTEIGTSTAVIDRNLISESIYFSEVRARQDLKLWIKLLGAGYLSHGINEVLVSYRVRPGSVSSNKIKMLWVTWVVYWNIENLSIIDKITCYLNYVFNAISKRVKS
tara:strand:+ start:16614 stop:17375 length:762 start_codon:yes stop_codon:yes gene_type:complete